MLLLSNNGEDEDDEDDEDEDDEDENEDEEAEDENSVLPADSRSCGSCDHAAGSAR